MRFFEEVEKEFLKFPGVETILPVRGSKFSAGYDFRVKENVILEPGEFKLIFTDVKAFMPEDECLKLYMRSSGPVGLILKNGTGIIDSDYYGNQKTGGNIGLPLLNISGGRIAIAAGTRIAQGIFSEYYITNDDEAEAERSGGFGSSGKN